ncbi:putative type VI secretion system effector [Serratia sp. DD3]|uniref:putative type VI secretion system effector n=1 Tax=Serratia sp. DD3 TaxID=1410619 RepID=UPI0004D3A26C|nr:putative type VI secretion system effector [Serratia sp. DD3]KEY59304.1 hypothetical protein SRDD_15840 [Serratia sp. DD3]
MKENEYLYNCTSSLRNEYKCFQDLEHDNVGLEVSIKIDNESLTKCESSGNQSEYNSKRIIELKSQITIAMEYINKIEEEMKNFPPFPELPPKKKLIKISGILEEVSFKKVIGYFEYTEYSTEKQRAEEKLKRDNSGAVLVAVLSAFANSTAPNLLKDGKKKEYRCIYVKGKIGGKSFSGWLNKTDIQVGDYLEMAVMPDGGEYKMYAVANPQQQTISTTPGCSAGSRCFTLIGIMKIVAIIFSFIILLPPIFASLTLKEWGYALLIYGALTGIISIIVYYISVKEERAPGDLFERICAALNIPDGKTLSLPEYTIKIVKKRKAQGLWKEPENKDVVIPQQRPQADYNFYFYPSNKKPD